MAQERFRLAPSLEDLRVRGCLAPPSAEDPLAQTTPAGIHNVLIIDGHTINELFAFYFTPPTDWHTHTCLVIPDGVERIKWISTPHIAGSWLYFLELPNSVKYLSRRCISNTLLRVVRLGSGIVGLDEACFEGACTFTYWCTPRSWQSAHSPLNHPLTQATSYSMKCRSVQVNPNGSDLMPSGHVYICDNC